MRRVAVVLVAGLAFAPRAWARDPYASLIVSLRSPSPPVRIDAVRRLGERLRGEGGAVPDAILTAVADAARGDSSHLVRGLACHVLGQLRDVRARPALEVAEKDPVPFVRVQAQEALGHIGVDAITTGLASDPISPASVRTRHEPLVARGQGDHRRESSPRIVVEDVPGVESPPDAKAHLLQALRTEAEATPNGFAGYALRGSIAERRVDAEGDLVHVSYTIRLTIVTWPENHLRHVFTAKASGGLKSKAERARRSVENKVLEAAAARAIRDARDALAAL